MNSYYVYSPGWTWANYLQAQSFENSLKSQISISCREIIGTTEQLQQEGIDVARELHSTMKAGFEEVTWRLADIQQGIDSVNANLVWGFSSVITAVGRVADSLDELICLSKNENKKRALEHFNDAKNAFDHGWHKEALKYIVFALNGDGNGPGYDLDFRFHHLLGSIRLGDLKNKVPEVLDSAAAEDSFLNAAKFAESDAPLAAAGSWLCAGVAAYSHGAFPRAITHFNQALKVNPKLGEAHFQLAKVLMHVNRLDEALLSLRNAISHDPNYMSKAGMDADFQKHQNEVNRLFAALREDAKHTAERNLEAMRQDAANLNALKIDHYTLVAYSTATIGSANAYINVATADLQKNTYLGYLAVTKACRQAKLRLNEAFSNFKETALHDLREVILQHERARVDFVKLSNQIGRPIGFTIVIICVLGSAISGAIYAENALLGFLGGAIGGAVLGTINAFIIAPIAAVIIAFFRRDAANGSHARRLTQLLLLQSKLASLTSPIY